MNKKLFEYELQVENFKDSELRQKNYIKIKYYKKGL